MSSARAYGAAAWVLFGLVGGCENGVTQPPFKATPESLLGVWKYDSGNNSFSSVYAQTFYRLQYAEFLDGGSMTLFGISLYGLVATFPGTFTVAGDMVMIESTSDEFFPHAFVYRMSNADSLSMIDEDEQAAKLKREAAVPAEARCRPLYRVKSHGFDVVPHPYTGLAYVDGKFWFTDEYIPDPLDLAEVYAVDPNSGAISKPAIPQSGYWYIETAQGPDTWRTCHCYNFAGLQRVDPNGMKLDEFNIESQLDAPVEISAVAFDEPAALLWVASERSDSALLAIDTQADPTIVRKFAPFHPLDGLAFDGALLWGLTRGDNVLVQIDPADGALLQSYKIPGRDVEWYDVIILSGRIFVIGKDTVIGTGVLTELSTVRPPLGQPPGGGATQEG